MANTQARAEVQRKFPKPEAVLAGLEEQSPLSPPQRAGSLSPLLPGGGGEPVPRSVEQQHHQNLCEHKGMLSLAATPVSPASNSYER